MKKKSILSLFRFNSRTQDLPKRYTDGSYYYPLSMFSPVYIEASNHALIEMYNEVPELNAVVNYIIQLCGSLKIEHYKKTSNGIEEVQNSKYIELLKNPNTFQTGTEYIEQSILYKILLGNSFINKIKPVGTGDYKELYVLPSQKILIDTKGAVNYKPASIDFRKWEITSYDMWVEGNAKMKFNPEEIIHIRDVNPNFDDGKYLYGYSRVLAAIKAITSLSAEYDLKTTFYQKRGMLGILVDQTEPQFALNSDEAKLVKKQIQDNYGGGGGRDVLAVTNKNLRYEQISMNYASLQISQSQIDDFRTVCKVIGGFPPRLLGDAAASTYNNEIEAKKSLYSNIIIPLMRSWCQSHTKGLGLPDNEYLKPDWSEIEALQSDQKQEAEKDSIQLRSILDLKKAVYEGYVTNEEAIEIASSMELIDTDINYIFSGNANNNEQNNS